MKISHARRFARGWETLCHREELTFDRLDGLVNSLVLGKNATIDYGPQSFTINILGDSFNTRYTIAE